MNDGLLRVQPFRDFAATSGIVDMAVASSVLLVASGQDVVRWDLASDHRSSIAVDEPVHRVFLDPTGKHALVSCRSGRALLSVGDKLAPLHRLKGLRIESVLWRVDEDRLSGSLTLGTADGRVLQLVLERGAERRVDDLMDLHTPSAVHLALDEGPPCRAAVATCSALHRYEAPTEETLFQATPLDREFPGQAPHVGIDVHVYRGQLWTAQITEAGVYVMEGDVGFMVPMEEPPSSVALTDFHLLVLLPRSLVAVSLISKEVVASRPMPPGSRLRWDRVNRDLWAVAEEQLFDIEVRGEGEGVWRLFLEAGRFADALVHSHGEDREEVLGIHGIHLFDQGNVNDAALIFAKSNRPFEEVALLFLEAKEVQALRLYLLSKLESYVAADRDSSSQRYLTQKSMIATWLLELFLDSLSGSQSSHARKELTDFLQSFHEHVHRETAYHLFHSHGLDGDLVAYAKLVGDHDRVLRLHLDQGDTATALHTLLSAPGPAPLLQRHLPRLLQMDPRGTVDALVQLRAPPEAALPHLLRSESLAQHATPYLEHCVFEQRSRDPGVHDALVACYLSSEEDLLRFIEAQRYNEVYDTGLALRLCLEQGQKRAAVALYSIKELYVEAVELALQFDVAVAIEAAETPSEEYPDKKKLWMLIANYLIHAGDVSRAIGLVRSSRLLRIEDVLPLFPDHIRIADLKEEIVASLEHYTTAIADLKTEMNEYTDTADRIRSDIQKLRHRFGDVAARQGCHLCKAPVLMRSFLLYPCSHVVHRDCAEAVLEQHLVRVPQRIPYFGSSSGPRSAPAMAQQECLFCGDRMIELTQVPFIDTERDREEAASWAL